MKKRYCLATSFFSLIFLLAYVIVNSAQNKRGNTAGESQLAFSLSDAQGRIVHSNDYLGYPVFFLSGACW